MSNSIKKHGYIGHNQNSGGQNKWFTFFNIILSPTTLFSTIVVLISLYFAYEYKDNLLFSTLLTIIASFFAGLAGSFVKDDYEKISGKSILEEKGKSAIRTLSSISRQIDSISEYIDLKIKSKKRIEKDFLVEVSRHLSTTQDQLDSGLHDWIDVVPTLKRSLTTFQKIEELEFEKKQLEKRTNNGTEEKENLVIEISKKEDEIQKLKRGLRMLKLNSRSTLNSSFVDKYINLFDESMVDDRKDLNINDFI